jgi:hypothetical protein
MTKSSGVGNSGNVSGNQAIRGRNRPSFNIAPLNQAMNKTSFVQAFGAENTRNHLEIVDGKTGQTRSNQSRETSNENSRINS